MFGSFFACYPIAASVCRTYVQDSAGGKTQVKVILTKPSALFVEYRQTVKTQIRCHRTRRLIRVSIVCLK